jgi:hypothetical protein
MYIPYMVPNYKYVSEFVKLARQVVTLRMCDRESAMILSTLLMILIIPDKFLPLLYFLKWLCQF